MSIATTLFAKLEYPPAWVMLVSTLVMVAFIGIGGWLFRRADERAKAEREALKAKEIEPTNP